MFRQDGLGDLAGLAWTVALIHLAGHALAKGAMFLTADGVYRQTGSYALVQSGLLQRSPWPFGLGALLAAMSLSAMPPQAGFVSEWYLFQTFFQGFHLASLASRLVAALAGAGLALTVAIAFATFVKAFGIGLLGRDRDPSAKGAPWSNAVAVGALGLLVLALAAGMPIWLSELGGAVSATLASNAPDSMRDGWLLVPLTSKFSFISPSKLVIAMPLLAIVPIALLLLTNRRPIRTAPVWYGGASEAPPRAATTALTFSNALRTFYSFIYRPTVETERETAKESRQPYFIKRLSFSHDVAPIFGPYLFVPLIRIVNAVAKRFRLIQSGQLNFYLSLIGGLLVLILLISLF
jgi:NADH:ubiquinone oxidoreductase subunit 5 (subunit L)/multisubunit Na+/H+ antiporter MnhA subunit